MWPIKSEICTYMVLRERQTDRQTETETDRKTEKERLGLDC